MGTSLCVAALCGLSRFYFHAFTIADDNTHGAVFGGACLVRADGMNGIARGRDRSIGRRMERGSGDSMVNISISMLCVDSCAY